MKREFLKNLGLADDIIDKIMDENGKDINAEKARADAAELTVKDLQDQIKERDKDIADLKKSSTDNADLTKKYEDLQAKYKTDTDALEKKLAEQQLDAALDAAIVGAKGKNAKAIKALLDFEKLSLKDGKVEGLNLDDIKKSDPYLFESDDAPAEPKFFGMTPGGKVDTLQGSKGMEQQVDDIMKGYI